MKTWVFDTPCVGDYSCVVKAETIEDAEEILRAQKHLDYSPDKYEIYELNDNQHVKFFLC